MSKGRKIRWTDEMDRVLREGYATRFNFELAEELGVSQRSVVRRLRELGLWRPDDFHSYTAEQRARLIRAGRVGKPNPGCIRKGEHRNPGGEFGHGRVISPEARQRGAAKGAAKRKETFKAERIRVKYGLPQRTRMNVNEPSVRTNMRRSYLRKFGYKIERGAKVAYYDENTRRCYMMEKRCRNIEFIDMETTRTKTDEELYQEALRLPWEDMEDYIEKIADPKLKWQLRQISREMFHREND